MQMTVNTNEGGQAMAGVDPVHASRSIGSSYTAATTTVPGLHISTHYPKTSPPTSHWPKLSPCGSVFGFFGLITPTSCATELHPPATSLPIYTTPVGSPLPQNQPTCIQLAKTEPLQLKFWFFSPNPPPPPLCATELQCPPTLSSMSPTPVGPLLPKK